MEIKDTPQGRRVWQEKLSESLNNELLRIYEDPDRAKELFMRVARGDTLKEREAAAAEIARLAPLGRKEEPVPIRENESMPVPENYERTEAPSKNMRAKDFEVGQRWTLTISDVNVEMMKERDDGKKPEEKLSVNFQGKEKAYIPNVGATMFLEDSLGKHPNNWIGATIQLGVFRVQYGDDMVNGFKVLNATPAPGKESPEQFSATDDDVPF